MALMKCKECGHEISDQAKSCPNCGAPQADAAAPTKPFGWGKLILLLFLGWILYEFLAAGFRSTPSSPSTVGGTALAPPAPSGPVLEVLSWRCDKEHRYIFVRGEVKNISSQPLKNVLAVGEFRTKSGELVKTETALLEYNPILPGQTSPFRAGGTDNPQIGGCNLAFKGLFGGELQYTEKPKEKRKGK